MKEPAYGTMKKKVVFYDSDKRYAELKIRLQHDGISQAQFFRGILTGYLKQDVDILNFVDKVFGNPTTLGVKKFPTHIGKKDLPGRIEIWPNFQKTKEKKELVAWWESFGS